MNEQNKPELKKDSVKSDDKNKEMDWREKIAVNIAGDNEMLKNAIRFITHPIVMFGGMLAFFYWLFKEKGQKEEIEKLLKANEVIDEKLKGIEKRFDELKTSHDKLKEEFQKTKEENTSGLGILPNQNANRKTKRYYSAYLD